MVAMGESDQTSARTEGVAFWAMRRRADDPRALGGAHQIAYRVHAVSVERPTDITRQDEGR